eukprot:s1859_g4.t1
MGHSTLCAFLIASAGTVASAKLPCIILAAAGLVVIQQYSRGTVHYRLKQHAARGTEHPFRPVRLPPASLGDLPVTHGSADRRKGRSLPGYTKEARLKRTRARGFSSAIFVSELQTPQTGHRPQPSQRMVTTIPASTRGRLRSRPSLLSNGSMRKHELVTAEGAPPTALPRLPMPQDQGDDRSSAGR